MHASKVCLQGWQRALFAVLLLPLLVSCEAIWGDLSRPNHKNCVSFPGSCRFDIEYCHPERETCVPYGPSCGVGQPSCDGTGPDQICYEQLGRCATNVILDAVEPATGPASGGIPITLNGRYFRPGMQVYFDQTPAPQVDFVSQSKLVATLPNSMGRLGPSIVRLVHADGGETERSGLFSYSAGQISFIQQPDSLSTSYAEDLILTDLNLDGITDVAVYGSNLLSSLLGDGTGYFQQPMPVPANTKLTGELAIGDINGDGYVDLIAPAEGLTMPSNGVLNMYFNNQFGKLQYNDQLTLGTGIRATHVVIGDMNNDNKPELLVATIDLMSQRNIVVFAGQGGGRFSTQPTTYSFTQTYIFQQITHLRMVDMNNDGYADFVVSGRFAPNAGSSLSGILAVIGRASMFATSSYEKTHDLSNFPSTSIVSDLNGDKIADIISSVDIGTTNVVTVILGAGGGSFEPPLQYQINSSQRFTRLQAHDFDGDGNLDILLWDPRIARLRLLLGSPNGNLRNHDQEFTLTSPPTTIKARDA